MMRSFGPVKSTIDIAAVRSSGEKTDLTRIARNFRLLCWRAWAEQIREIPTIVIKMFVTCFFASIIGGIYSNAGYSQKAIANRTGLLFIIVLNQAFNGCLGVLNTFPKVHERPLSALFSYPSSQLSPTRSFSPCR